MKKIDLVLYIILIAIIAIGAYTIYSFIVDKPADREMQALSLKTILTGSTDSGDVAIDLTPVKIDEKNFVLNIALNTHSVELSQFDLKRIVTLEYNGKTIYPTEAPEIEGHHSFGSILFNVDGDLKGFTVTIKGIPKVGERIYEWKR